VFRRRDKIYNGTTQNREHGSSFEYHHSSSVRIIYNRLQHVTFVLIFTKSFYLGGPSGSGNDDGGGLRSYYFLCPIIVQAYETWSQFDLRRRRWWRWRRRRQRYDCDWNGGGPTIVFKFVQAGFLTRLERFTIAVKRYDDMLFFRLQKLAQNKTQWNTAITTKLITKNIE